MEFIHAVKLLREVCALPCAKENEIYCSISLNRRPCQTKQARRFLICIEGFHSQRKAEFSACIWVTFGGIADLLT